MVGTELPPRSIGYGAIEKGWWAIGAAFAVRAQPERWLACGPTELLYTRPQQKQTEDYITGRFG